MTHCLVVREQISDDDVDDDICKLPILFAQRPYILTRTGLRVICSTLGHVKICR